MSRANADGCLSIAALVVIMVSGMTSASSTHTSPEYHRYTGICDASGVVAIGDREFAVADDELNRLSVYRLDTPGASGYSLEISDFLKLNKPDKKPEKEPKEADLEGATRIGDTIYWISSHGRNSKGKKAKGRMQFFATKIQHHKGNSTLVPVGNPYNQLLHDLVNAPQHKSFNLHIASELSPKVEGGLNIEALTNMPNGHLLIGFRSPILEGKSLIVELLNPDGVIQGQAALFGQPRLIGLDGGIRAMASHGNQYLIIGNERSAEGGESALFVWDGESEEVSKVKNIDFADFNPEAIAIFPDDEGGQILLLSDDGVRDVEGRRCKDIVDREQRFFRSMLYRHPGLRFL